MRKVMIVEDDDDLLFVAAYALEKNGYMVLPVVVGELVFEEVQKIQPDLILMDINLRTCDGRQLCLKLKTQFHLKTPILLFSANTQFASTIHQYKADGFIAKPFDMKSLVASVHKFLDPGNKVVEM